MAYRSQYAQQGWGPPVYYYVADTHALPEQHLYQPLPAQLYYHAQQQYYHSGNVPLMQAGVPAPARLRARARPPQYYAPQNAQQHLYPDPGNRNALRHDSPTLNPAA